MGRSVHIRIRNGRLYLETYMYGRQSRRALGLSLTGDKVQDKKVMKLAEIIRSRREMQLACVEWGIPDLLGSDRILTIYIEENYQKSKNYTLARCLHYIKKYRNSNVKLSEVNERWIEDFQGWLVSESGLSQGSASLYSSMLRHQLRLAVRDKILLSSPAQFVRNIPMPESKKQPLSLEQLRNLAEIQINGNLGSEIRLAFFFSCLTGFRVSDLKELKFGMVYRDSDGKLWISKKQKKTGHVVNIPLHENAVKIIRAQKENAFSGEALEPAAGRAICGKETGVEKAGNVMMDFVFPLLAQTKSNTDQYLKKWGLAAGIEHVSWHTARHTFATIALENGAEIRTVSELLGHTNLSTTMRYAKATDVLKKSAIAAIPEIG